MIDWRLALGIGFAGGFGGILALAIIFYIISWLAFRDD